MQRKGMEPNVITYNALINACAKGDSYAVKTVQLLAEMHRKGLEPDVITYNAPSMLVQRTTMQRRLRFHVVLGSWLGSYEGAQDPNTPHMQQ